MMSTLQPPDFIFMQQSVLVESSFVHVIVLFILVVSFGTITFYKFYQHKPNVLS